MLTLLLVCSFSPRVHSIPRGPRILLHEKPSSVATKNPTRFVGFLWQRTLTLIETILRGCNSRSEGVHFSSKGGGAVLDLRECITLPVRTAINRGR